MVAMPLGSGVRRVGAVLRWSVVVAMLLGSPLVLITAQPAPAGAATISDLKLAYQFVSSKGWVKPGEQYPATITLTNPSTDPISGATVNIPAVDGMTFVSATPLQSGGTATVGAGGSSISWAPGPFAGVNPSAPNGVVQKLIVEATAKSTAADPQIVWKDLSATATLSFGGGTTTASTHGPKVIPTDERYDTARYGDRPFPVVPVDYTDRHHDTANHPGSKLNNVINDPTPGAGSTFNLYQEMSYGQLYPMADVPSAGIATKDWSGFDASKFTTNPVPPPSTCHGATLGSAVSASPLSPNRISDGWYQLPGSTDYYGDDANGSAIIGAETGVSQLQNIDSACGPTSKSVYDAAVVADPEIDYNDFDTDKDGVVDFFMMVFVGLGGNGDSQLNGVPPYDNIWPHSADLQNEFTGDRGQKGYITSDPLISLSGMKQCFVDPATATGKQDCPNQAIANTDPSVIHVRVGPYNVNPGPASNHPAG